MKKLAIVLLAGGLAFGMTSCAPQSNSSHSNEEKEPMYHSWFYQDLPDGGKVLCVWNKNLNAGGISCDWEHKITRDN